MSVGFPEGSLVHYVDDHTGCTESSWSEANLAQKGLFPFVAINNANRDEFLGLIRLHRQSDAVCNPLDGEVHDLSEMVTLLGDGRYVSAFRFICLGVGLGVFSMVPGTWDSARRLSSGPVNRDSIERWIEGRLREGEECRFQCDPEFIDLMPRSIRYHIYRDVEGRPAEPFQIANSIADSRDLIRMSKRPGRYTIYERHFSKIPGQYVPVEWGHMMLHADGRLEEERASSILRRLIAELQNAQARSQKQAEAKGRPVSALCRKIVRMSSVALYDWRSLRPSDWETNGWDGLSQDITSIDRPNSVFLDAITERLKRFGVTKVIVQDEPNLYIEVSPE
jgi:hypothetical protein